MFNSNERFEIAEKRKDAILKLVSNYVIKRFGRVEAKDGESQDERLLRLDYFKETLNIIDLRSGRGWLLERLYNCGYRKLFGIDIDRIRIRSSSYAMDSLSEDMVVREDAYAIKVMFNSHCANYDFLKNNFFDIVLSVNMLGYLKNVRDFISQISNVVLEGGILIFSTPNSYGDSKVNKAGIRLFNLDDLINLPFDEKFILKEHFITKLEGEESKGRGYEQAFTIFEKKKKDENIQAGNQTGGNSKAKTNG